MTTPTVEVVVNFSSVLEPFFERFSKMKRQKSMLTGTSTIIDFSRITGQTTTSFLRVLLILELEFLNLSWHNNVFKTLFYLLSSVFLIMYGVRNLEMSICFFLKSRPSERFHRPEMSQIKAEISLRTNVKLNFHKNVGLQ